MLKKKADYEAEWLKKERRHEGRGGQAVSNRPRRHRRRWILHPGNALYGKEEALQRKLFEIRIKYLKQMQAAYNQASEDWHTYQVQIEQAEGGAASPSETSLAQRIAEWEEEVRVSGGFAKAQTRTRSFGGGASEETCH